MLTSREKLICSNLSGFKSLLPNELAVCLEEFGNNDLELELDNLVKEGSVMVGFLEIKSGKKFYSLTDKGRKELEM